jgi:hypothetical protein
MMKRSLFLTVAAGLLASVAFATPSHAGTAYALDIAFDITPSNITASDVEVTLSGAVPASGYTIANMGGLNITSVTGVGDVITINFDAKNHTTPTTNPAVEIDFTGSAGSGEPGGINGSPGTLRGSEATSGQQEDFADHQGQPWRTKELVPGKHRETGQPGSQRVSWTDGRTSGVWFADCPSGSARRGNRRGISGVIRPSTRGTVGSHL